MSLTLGEIAELVGGELTGPADRVIEAVAGIQTVGPGKISLVEDKRYAPYLDGCDAGAVMLGPDIEAPDGLAVVRVDDPGLQFERVIDALHPPMPDPEGIHETALIHESAELGEGVKVGPYVIIDPNVKIGARTVIRAGTVIHCDVTVGEDCQIFENCILYPNSVVGNRVWLQGGVQIGAEGYGNRMVDGEWQKIRHVGNAVIEDDVELGGNVFVSRSRMDTTRVGKGCRIDGFSYVGHNAQVGKQTAIAGFCAIAGSVKIGDYCMIGGQTGIQTHTEVGNQCQILGQSGIMETIADGEKWGGYPAVIYKDFVKSMAIRRKLPALFDRVKELEKELAALKAQITDVVDSDAQADGTE